MENEVVTQPIAIQSPIRTEVAITIDQEPFYLTEANFLQLQYGGSNWSEWGKGLFAAGLGSLINPLGKVFQAALGAPTAPIELWEWTAGVICALLGAGLLVIGRFTKNLKRDLLRDISLHFEGAEKTRRIKRAEQ